MAEKKQQQEMVQVDRSSSASPFWRNNSGASKSRESKKVVGASYSHTDILRFDSLSVSSSSRPRTVNSNESPPASRSGTTVTSPGRKPFPPTYLSSDPNPDEDEDEDNQEITFDDDEDEFGLPSIASMRRKGKRKPLNKGKDPGGTHLLHGSMDGGLESTQPWRLDSGDIAEERNGSTIPLYPTAKPSVGKILRPQYQDILRDPANALHLIAHPNLPANSPQKEVEAHSARISRISKFKRILQSSNIAITELRSTAWSGIPVEVRAMTWQLLLGYLPANSERRVATLERKRKEYSEAVDHHFPGRKKGQGIVKPSSVSASGTRGRGGDGPGGDKDDWRQISIDVPRTNPHLELYSYEATQRSLEHILYIWAIRHPASGYVQGINDLVTPFWQVFLGAYITDPDVESGMDPGQLPDAVLEAVEADSFWCLTKLLDSIQDNYINKQPGIQRQVASLRDLTTRIDKTLADHLEKEGIEFIQFSFRWMNCLLMREISVKNTIRMWDTYLSEERGFSDFHLYVCAAFLVKWSDQLVKMDFQEIMMFLQSLPTRNWTEKDIELLLSEAFIWQSHFPRATGLKKT